MIGNNSLISLSSLALNSGLESEGAISAYKAREYSKRTGETGLIKSAQGALGYKFTGGGGKRKKPSMQSLPAPKAIPPTTKQQQAGYSSIYGTSEIAPTYKIS